VLLGNGLEDIGDRLAGRIVSVDRQINPAC